ncbi:hypothetical protein lerEdw1_014689 [Lerista edwardsae]|nr:hypothetical protein lerEdw1_014689 [Lerista edwardsae]
MLKCLCPPRLGLCRPSEMLLERARGEKAAPEVCAFSRSPGVLRKRHEKLRNTQIEQSEFYQAQNSNQPRRSSGGREGVRRSSKAAAITTAAGS